MSNPVKTCEYCGATGSMPTFMDGETICYTCLGSFPEGTRDMHHVIYDLREKLNETKTSNTKPS